MARVVLVPARQRIAPLIRDLGDGLAAQQIPCRVSADLGEASSLGVGTRWAHAIGSVRALVQDGGPCTLVGYSLGALTAARVAATMPARVSGLVLIAPVMSVDGRAAMAQQGGLQHLVQFLRRMEEDAGPTFLQGAQLVARLPVDPVVVQGKRDQVAPPWRARGKIVALDDNHFFENSQRELLALVTGEARAAATR